MFTYGQLTASRLRWGVAAAIAQPGRKGQVPEEGSCTNSVAPTSQTPKSCAGQMMKQRVKRSNLSAPRPNRFDGYNDHVHAYMAHPMVVESWHAHRTGAVPRMQDYELMPIPTHDIRNAYSPRAFASREGKARVQV